MTLDDDRGYCSNTFCSASAFYPVRTYSLSSIIPVGSTPNFVDVSSSIAFILLLIVRDAKESFEILKTVKPKLTDLILPKSIILTIFFHSKLIFLFN